MLENLMFFLIQSYYGGPCMIGVCYLKKLILIFKCFINQIAKISFTKLNLF